MKVVDEFAAPQEWTPTNVITRHDGRHLYQLSASAISKFLTCPEQFRQSYLLGNWPPTVGAMVLGTAYHEARRVNYTQKVWSGDDLPVEKVLEAYYASFDQQLGSRITIHWQGEKTAADLRKLGAEMTEQYHRAVSPTVFPMAVEEQVVMQFDGVPVRVVAIPDVLTHDSRIIDTKTDAKKLISPHPHWRVQALVYLAGFPDRSFEWHVHSKGPETPIITPASNPRFRLANSRSRAEQAEALVVQTWNAMTDLFERYGRDRPWPGTALVHTSACGTCRHKPRCFWWR